MSNGETVHDVYNTFTTQQKSILGMIISVLPNMTDDQLRVASFLFTSAVEDEARKRVQRPS